jgi:hypothetical protein
MPLKSGTQQRKNVSPMADYTPGGDAEFNAWLDNLTK